MEESIKSDGGVPHTACHETEHILEHMKEEMKIKNFSNMKEFLSGAHTMYP